MSFSSSSTSSTSSCAGSTNQHLLSPLTPDSYFSPTPAIAGPDLDDLAGSHPPPVQTDPCFLSADDTSKLQVFLSRWGNSTSDDFSSALLDHSDPSRCSLLIHEVSLLVGLTPNDDPDDPTLLVPDASKQVHDILPLSLTPPKSLASRKHKNAGLPRATNTNPPLHPSPSGINPYVHNQGPPLVGLRNLATPILRHKSADAERPYLSPRRRQGRVFHFEPPRSNAFDLDETFCSPRPPPSKPTPSPVANRCSSLDRLECSLLKLEAHAPRNHRKSRSEGRPSDRVPQREINRPSLPPPRHLKQQQSSHKSVPRHLARPAHGRMGPPPPVPKPTLHHQYVAPRIYPAFPPDNHPLEEDITPGSFMDMDIPQAEEAGPRRRTSFRQVKSKEKVKNLVSVAKRVSRSVIAWGKNLTGSTKPAVTAQETTTVRV